MLSDPPAPWDSEALADLRCGAAEDDPWSLVALWYAQKAPELASELTFEEAFGALRRAVDLGDAAAYFEYGWAYAEGLGVPKDLAEAARWWRKAAEAGDVWAMTDFGHACFYGEGTPKNPAEAVRWWRKAWAEGRDAMAAFNLGIAYDHGSGVPPSLGRATAWWRKAARLGLCPSPAQFGRVV